MNSFTQVNINDSIHLDETSLRYRPFDCSQNFNSQHNSISSYTSTIMNPSKLSADDGIGGGAKGNMVPLPLDFVPGNFDVLCGRGKKNYNSLGNQRLRQIVESYVDQYSAATSRQDKSDILSAIVNEVRQSSPHGGFIKQDPGSDRWFEVGDFLAREKVSQAFRDALSSRYRSSKKFKHEKRRQRDKAAKLAKLKGESKEGDESKSPSSKSPSGGSESLLRKQNLLVLREDPTMSSSSVVPPLQGSVQPSRAISTGHGFSSSLLPDTSLFHDNSRQGFMSAERSQQQMPGTQAYAFNAQGVLPHQGNSTMVHGHNSWPQLFASANPQFNQFNGGSGIGGPHNMAMTMANRRFSTGPMASDLNQMSLHHFHQSEPNPQNWNHHLHEASVASQMIPNNNEFSPAGLNHPFLTGMGLQQPGPMGMSNAAAAMMTNVMATNVMPTNTMPINTMPTNTMPASAPTHQHHQHHHHHHHQSQRRKGPLERSNSNISTASATAIVARLESSLSDLEHDENPFEPVPLPGDEEVGSGTR